MSSELCPVATAIVRQARAGETAIRPLQDEDTPWVVGLDLGGTKLRGAISGPGGEILRTLEQPTRHGTEMPVLDQLAEVALELATGCELVATDVACLVIGVPGIVSPRSGLTSHSPNLQLPEGVPLADVLSARVPFPVVVENDVNLAALAEAHEGKGQGGESMAFVSFGTGVGVGLVIDGKLIRGAQGRAGEISLLPVGGRPHKAAVSSLNGLYEDLVGTPALLKAGDGLFSSVVEMFQRAEAGELACLSLVEALAQNASLGIASIAALFDPELIVVGGGIGSQTLFRERLTASVEDLLPFPVRIEGSAFESDAGVVGAVVAARQWVQSARIT